MAEGAVLPIRWENLWEKYLIRDQLTGKLGNKLAVKLGRAEEKLHKATIITRQSSNKTYSGVSSHRE